MASGNHEPAINLNRKSESAIDLGSSFFYKLVGFEPGHSGMLDWSTRFHICVQFTINTGLKVVTPFQSHHLSISTFPGV